ncbi:MAG: hypothetical protein KGL39_59440 [Patescibacteria group bacterium]|nr:hypothetical protein [Patescibacteria group bacterium]
MKKIRIAIAALAITVAACSTTQQDTAYKTIATTETAASAVVDGYYALVIKGVLPTNDVPNVSKMFNDLQAAGTLAAATSQNGTNALAPAQLTDELNRLITLVSTITTNSIH